MKKIVAGLMVAAAMFSFGCGRSAEFGVVDMQKVGQEAPIIKTTEEAFNKQRDEMMEQMRKDMEGKSGEELQKVHEDYTAKAKLMQSEAQNKMKSSLDAALSAVAKEKKLGAILDKRAVPQGGTDVTSDVIAKMQ